MRITENQLDKIRTEYVMANPNRCMGCWKCLDACPQHIIGKVGFLWHQHIVFTDSQSCTGCKKCVRACPNRVFS